MERKMKSRSSQKVTQVRLQEMIRQQLLMNVRMSGKSFHFPRTLCSICEEFLDLVISAHLAHRVFEK